MFNQEFDRSLWLMLVSDKNNREDMINFISCLPNELYEQINIQLDKYKDYEERNVYLFEREDTCLCGNCLGKFNEKYSFIIDMVENSLTIIMGIEREDIFMKAFEVTLYAKSRCNDIDILDEQLLGYVINHTDGIKTKYVLVDTLFGKMVMYSGNGIFKKYKRIEKNSENMDLSILFDKTGISKVRKKK